jgi:hypothetical protein
MISPFAPVQPMFFRKSPFLYKVMAEKAESAAVERLGIIRQS